MRLGALARALRAGWGALLLATPEWPLRASGGLDSREVRAAVRVLGARHLAESLVLSRTADVQAPRWIRGIDLAHCLSMMALAAASSRLRRDALLSAASAAALVTLSTLEG